MTYRLVPHPDHPPLEVVAVDVEVWGGRRDLMLAYEVRGTEKLLLPPTTVAGRRDELWQTTCFELFLRGHGETYLEFNFSSSTCWAIYSFESYRRGMKPTETNFQPIIEPWGHGLEANCDPGDLPDAFPAMALSAVIEEEGGTKSYWALAHPTGPPDFHHPACFAARLPAPKRA